MTTRLYTRKNTPLYLCRSAGIPYRQCSRLQMLMYPFEAESIAFTVCQHYGLDTSDYSFGYVAGWSSGRELAELKSSLEIIKSTAAKLIEAIDGHFAEIQKEQAKGQAQAQPEAVTEPPDPPRARAARSSPAETSGHSTGNPQRSPTGNRHSTGNAASRSPLLSYQRNRRPPRKGYEQLLRLQTGQRNGRIPQLH